MFYVQVDDPAAHLARAEELGGKTVTPVMSIPGMVTLAQFADPEGNVIGLVAAEVPPAE
jgi:predicted enzyme related to lactoylglutathione lyase